MKLSEQLLSVKSMRLLEEELVSEPPESSEADDLKLDEKAPVAGGAKVSSRTYKVDRRSAKSIRAQEREDRESRKSKNRAGGGVRQRGAAHHCAMHRLRHPVIRRHPAATAAGLR